MFETKRDIVPILLSLPIGQEEEEAKKTKLGIESLETASRSTFVELLLEGLASGFEAGMELYRKEEWPRVWFVVGEIANDLEGIWRDLLEQHGGKSRYLESKMGEARAAKEMARASFIVSFRSLQSGELN